MRNKTVIFIILAFTLDVAGPLPAAQGQLASPSGREFVLPAPGTMVALSPAYNPPLLKGLKVHPDNPFRFDFILDQGDSALPTRGHVPLSRDVSPRSSGRTLAVARTLPTKSTAESESTPGKSPNDLKQEANKLIKYFLASLTIPEKDLWVNLSPYEKNRIIPDAFGKTEMGRDLLAEDYMLKQITSSLIYPEGETGKKFWKKVYAQAAKRFGTTNIPVNTFNKVWIVPEKAVVYENAKAGTAYVVESKLKVMLEEDYLSQAKHGDVGVLQNGDCPVNIVSQGTVPILKDPNICGISSQMIREIVIPELTKEVNTGANFAQLRQVYNSLILATWYKKKIKDSILTAVYANQNKIQGITITTPGVVEVIYRRYLQAFKKGAYNFIKEETDPVTRQPIPRKYFSGGFGADGISTKVLEIIDSLSGRSPAMLGLNLMEVDSDLAMIGSRVDVFHAFRRKDGLGKSLPAAFVVKGRFDNEEKNKLGFVSIGGLDPTRLDLVDPIWHEDFRGPYGIATVGKNILIGALDGLHIFDKPSDAHAKVIYNDKLYGLHTIQTSPLDPDIVLMAASESHLIAEMNVKTGEIVWEWNADGSRPNGAAYNAWNPNEILATLFKTNQAVVIGKDSAEVKIVDQDLISPHGFVPFQKGFVISNTAAGKVLFYDQRFRLQREFDFTQFPLRQGIQNGGIEWIQNTIPLTSHLLATIDSRRQQVYVWDPQQSEYTLYPFYEDFIAQSLYPVVSPHPDQDLAMPFSGKKGDAAMNDTVGIKFQAKAIDQIKMWPLEGRRGRNSALSLRQLAVALRDSRKKVTYAQWYKKFESARFRAKLGLQLTDEGHESLISRGILNHENLSWTEEQILAEIKSVFDRTEGDSAMPARVGKNPFVDGQNYLIGDCLNPDFVLHERRLAQRGRDTVAFDFLGTIAYYDGSGSYKLRPGIEEVLERLKRDHNYRLALWTTGKRQDIEHLHLGKYFDVIITRENRPDIRFVEDALKQIFEFVPGFKNAEKQRLIRLHTREYSFKNTALLGYKVMVDDELEIPMIQSLPQTEHYHYRYLKIRKASEDQEEEYLKELPSRIDAIAKGGESVDDSQDEAMAAGDAAMRTLAGQKAVSSGDMLWQEFERRSIHIMRIIEAMPEAVQDLYTEEVLWKMCQGLRDQHRGWGEGEVVDHLIATLRNEGKTFQGPMNQRTAYDIAKEIQSMGENDGEFFYNGSLTREGIRTKVKDIVTRRFYDMISPPPVRMTINSVLRFIDRYKIEPVPGKSGMFKLILKDPAMMNNEAARGGIDLRKLDVQGQGSITFHLDPAMLKQFEHTSGFEPVVTRLAPVQDLRFWLLHGAPS